MQQREQPLHALALLQRQLVLDRQLELLDEADLLVERVGERHAAVRAQLAAGEAEAAKGRGIEARSRVRRIYCHAPSLEPGAGARTGERER